MIRAVTAVVLIAGAGVTGYQLRTRDAVAAVNASPDTLRMELTVDTVLASCAPTNQMGSPLALGCTWASKSPGTVKVLATTGSSVKVVGVSPGGSWIVAVAKNKRDSLWALAAAATVAECVSGPTTICAGDDWQSKINAQGAVTFTAGPGVHALQSVVPKSGQTFRGEPGAVMDGAKKLTGWVASGATWYVDGQVQQHPVATHSCAVDFPACNYQEDLWVDSTLLKRVLSIAEVSVTTWYFDYAADRIYVGVNPSGHTIATSVITQAFSGNATGVRIVSLTIKHYANPAQQGCVQGPSWIVDSNDVSGCHGIGIKLTGDNAKIRWNYVHHNGQLGVAVAGGKVGDLVYGNEVAYNNTAGYFGGWEAGGSKFVYTTNLIVRKNHFHDNMWNGIWPDINNTNTLIDSNKVNNNWAIGISCEISWGCTIQNNIIDNNGAGASPFAIQRVGIVCSATPDCHISNNTLHGNLGGDIVLYQQDRSTDQPDPAGRGDHIVANANVHDNIIFVAASSPMPVYASGFRGNYQQVDFLHNRNNCFTNNTWHLPGGTTKFFIFGNGTVTDAVWQSSGCNSGEVITR